MVIKALNFDDGCKQLFFLVSYKIFNTIIMISIMMFLILKSKSLFDLCSGCPLGLL